MNHSNSGLAHGTSGSPQLTFENGETEAKVRDKVPRRLTNSQMEFLTQEYGIEFAQVYELGTGKDGKGGRYMIYSGNVNSVTIPITSKTILINHTHPGGTPYPSDKDLKLMEFLTQMGSPQKTSGIVPVGKKTVKFTKKGLK